MAGRIKLLARHATSILPHWLDSGAAGARSASPHPRTSAPQPQPHLRQKRKPEPRGPRRYLRPVPHAKSQPIAATSTGNWPMLWQASSIFRTPARRHSWPTAAASYTRPAVQRRSDKIKRQAVGCMRAQGAQPAICAFPTQRGCNTAPELVGTCEMATSAGRRPVASMPSSAAASTSPSGVSGMTSMLTPVRLLRKRGQSEWMRAPAGPAPPQLALTGATLRTSGSPTWPAAAGQWHCCRTRAGW